MKAFILRNCNNAEILSITTIRKRIEPISNRLRLSWRNNRANKSLSKELGENTLKLLNTWPALKWSYGTTSLMMNLSSRISRTLWWFLKDKRTSISIALFFKMFLKMWKEVWTKDRFWYNTRLQKEITEINWELSQRVRSKKREEEDD